MRKYPFLFQVCSVFGSPRTSEEDMPPISALLFGRIRAQPACSTHGVDHRHGEASYLTDMPRPFPQPELSITLSHLRYLPPLPSLPSLFLITIIIMLFSTLAPISALLLGSALAQTPPSFTTGSDALPLSFSRQPPDNGYMRTTPTTPSTGAAVTPTATCGTSTRPSCWISTLRTTRSVAPRRQQLCPCLWPHAADSSVTDTVKAIANNTNVSDYKKKNSIIAIDGGGNNLFGALNDIKSGKMNIFYFIDTMVQNQIDSIKALLDDGYRKIYLLNLPSLTMAPAVAEYGTIVSALAGILTPLINAAFLAKLGILKLTNMSKAAEVKFFDMQDLMDTSNSDVVLNALNITDTKNPCVVDHADGSQTYCTDDNVRYYYDSFHPSGRPHYLIGVAFANIVKNPSYAINKWSLADIAKQYAMGASDNKNNIIANDA
ncbi:hypothetical protein DL89DRAFT_262945 [Linderina pennispora]|uniref:SGNH hydrolase n=1 Tax=Linderina pennispora TaxID=61395 RepID=A0A1Y1VRK5_9FUNG|nr:uncharacterized protein DL89DRAFT_262945 [Linderina pennispora]ORX63921.1 hypothetical protein DL89DRAFT_262945 [Linderina pennispora]